MYPTTPESPNYCPRLVPCQPFVVKNLIGTSSAVHRKELGNNSMYMISFVVNVAKFENDRRIARQIKTYSSSTDQDRNEKIQEHYPATEQWWPPLWPLVQCTRNYSLCCIVNKVN